jgi:D-alanine-D-alanine ligase
MNRIAIVQGGPSSEAAVSRVSAQSVDDALQALGYPITRLELNEHLAQQLLAAQVDLVFPVVHGVLGEDGCLQGLCEILGLPYVGSAVLGSALAADKIQAKRLFRSAGLPLAEEIVLSRGCNAQEAAKQARQAVGPALVVKPATQGSALGVTRIMENDAEEDVVRALEQAFRFDEFVLCERFVRGREITCGVLDVQGLGGKRALPVTEIRSNMADFYDYRSRYAPGGSSHVCPAELPPSVFEKVQKIAVAAHSILGCRDLSRADFVVGDGNNPDAITLLEVNTMPGMTPTSLFPEQVQAIGISFQAMCQALVEQALTRSSRTVAPQFAMPT